MAELSVDREKTIVLRNSKKYRQLGKGYYTSFKPCEEAGTLSKAQ
jgi:hypothetical protein